MKEIPTLFQRDFVGEHTKKNFNAIDKVEEGCEWVINGEGVSTQKHDGSACLVNRGMFYRRLRVKAGNTMPLGWLHWSLDPNEESGHGWVLVGDGPGDVQHREAWAALKKKRSGQTILEGTYELCGPKVQGNPEKLDGHVLLRHGCVVLEAVPLTFYHLRAYLATRDIEGIVWHHQNFDGRMCKLKKRDFGLIR